MEELTIGFLSSAKFENDAAIRGAVLVTDMQTKLLEFRVTAPVRPTNFQKTLYGVTEYILVELVTIPLLNALNRKPEIVVVRDSLFLGANDKQDVPIIRVFKEGEIRFSVYNKAEQLASIGGKYEPIMIETSKALEPMLPELRKQHSEVFSKRSLLEPFDRIQTALQQVHSQKVGE